MKYWLKATVSRQKRNLILAVTTLTVVAITLIGSSVKSSAQTSLFRTQPLIQQRVAQTTTAPASPGDLWRQVYKRLPDLPLENKYLSKETGKVAADNTLVARLIRYHVYVKGRPTNSRLDWKLTLADYLDANEVMQESQYPGNDTLRQNPFAGDRAAINRLNRKQRDALVQTLASLFSPNASSPQTPTSGSSQPSAAPNSDAKPNLPQPEPGGARLLLP